MYLSDCLVMNTRESLQRLVSLTKDERFRKAITTIEFYPVTFSNRFRAQLHGEAVIEDDFNQLSEMMNRKKLFSSEKKPTDPDIAKLDRDRRVRRRKNHDRQKHDQNTMRATSIDVELLTEAMYHLPTLKSIRTVSRFDITHPPLAGRDLYYEIGEFPGLIQCVEDSILYAEDRATLAHTTAMIFAAIMRSNCQLKTLEFQDLPRLLPLSQTVTSRRLSRTSTPPKTLAKSSAWSVRAIKAYFPYPGVAHCEAQYQYEPAHHKPLILDGTPVHSNDISSQALIKRCETGRPSSTLSDSIGNTTASP